MSWTLELIGTIAEYKVIIGGHHPLVVYALASRHFHEVWTVEEEVFGKRPKTFECWGKVAKAMDAPVRVAKWLDWARRNPMEAREVLDLAPKDRTTKGHEPPDGFREPTWWPLAYSERVPLKKREYVVQRCDDWETEPFGFHSDTEAASVHFAHWELRTDVSGFHHVVASKPRSRIGKIMCEIADSDRKDKQEFDDALVSLEAAGLIELAQGRYKLTEKGTQELSL